MTQEEQNYSDHRSNHFMRWLRNWLLIIAGLIGLLGLVLLVGITLVINRPVDLTILARYWLPYPIIAGLEEGQPAGRINFDQLTLYWPVMKKGFDAPIQFGFNNLKILDGHNQIADQIKKGAIELAVRPLLRGHVVPNGLMASGARLTLKVDSQHQIGLYLWGANKVGKKQKFFVDLKHLHQIDLQDMQINIVNTVDHKIFKIDQLDMKLHPFYIENSLAVIGSIAAQANMNSHRISLIATSRNDHFSQVEQQQIKKIGKLQWHIELGGIDIADFSGVMPSLKVLGNIDLPLSAQADINFKADKHRSFLQPNHLNLIFKLGSGKVKIGEQNLYPSQGGGHILADFSSDTKHSVDIKIQDTHLQLRSPTQLKDVDSGPVFDLQGGLYLSSLIHPKATKIEFSAYSPQLDFSVLKNYWPHFVAKGAYDWVTENMTKGIAKNFQIRVGLEGNEGFKNLRLARLEGGIQQAEGLEVHWLKPIAPLHDMKAQLSFVDPDRLRITYQGGYQPVFFKGKNGSRSGKLFIPEGEMWIVGLSNHQELGIITPTIQGDLQNVLALLAEPRLQLLSRHPIRFTNPSGATETHLHIEVPLKKKVKINQVMIKAHAQLQNVSLDNVVLGKGLRDAKLSLDADSKHLEITGQGKIEFIPTQLQYRQNFTHQTNHDIVESAKLNLQTNSEILKRITGSILEDYVTGYAMTTVKYWKQYSGKGNVAFKSDLMDLGIHSPVWEKSAGEFGSISGEIDLNKDQIVQVHNLEAVGPHLLIHADGGVDGQILNQLTIHFFHINQSIGQATVFFPLTKDAINHPDRGDVRVSIKADSLDVSSLLETYAKQSKGTVKKQGYQLPIAATGRYDGPRGRHWIVNIQASKVYYNKDQFVGNVTTYMEYNGIRLTQLSYGMRSPTTVIASLFPKQGHRYFHVEIQDLGILLNKMTGSSIHIKGGHTVFQGKLNDQLPSAPLRGELQIGTFTLMNAPPSLHQLKNLSLYGLFSQQKNNEMSFKQLEGEFFLDKGKLTVANGLVYNATLGATLQGQINLNQAQLDMEGTIIPAYALNVLPGKIPGIGKLFSPEKGGGVIAATFDVKGNFHDPSIEMYSSKVLMPGFLRSLF